MHVNTLSSYGVGELCDMGYVGVGGTAPYGQEYKGYGAICICMANGLQGA